jgi:hypothetical protein
VDAGLIKAARSALVELLRVLQSDLGGSHPDQSLEATVFQNLLKLFMVEIVFFFFFFFFFFLRTIVLGEHCL